MMSLKSKRELVEAIRPRYKKATGMEKESILNEFIANTGYHRKSAIRALNYSYKATGNRKAGRKKIYLGEVVVALEMIWEVLGRICSSRLKPFLPEIVTVMERTGELRLSKENKELLLAMSRATIDRCLKRARFTPAVRGRSTTKPGSLLKGNIPVKVFTPWDDEKPGFVEIDLVAHCGVSVEGVYLNTLTATDIATGWTECLGLANKTQTAVLEAIVELRRRLPFPLLGIDSDNGSEFINEALFKYCNKEKIDFTRSRPYHKNDQAHVEQKNWSVVRHTIGYERMETDEALVQLRAIYDDLRLYINYFQPTLKLVGKKQVDGHTKRIYDEAKTPYRRVLAMADLPILAKARLPEQYMRLNPVALRTSIDAKVDQLYKIVR
jgi:hypothetical protein